MKRLLTKKIGLILILITFFYSFSQILTDDDKKGISVEKAVNEKIVKAEISGKGGHSGECIKITVENISDKDTLIRFEPGRRLVSSDTTIQDILIIKELLLFLKKGEKQDINVYGFCCEASMRNPYSKSVYEVGFMEKTSLVKLSEFFNENVYEDNVMQNAVWCLSDGHAINSIVFGDTVPREKREKLYSLISNLKNEIYVYPWYYLSYVSDTSLVFSDKPERLYGEIEYTLKHHSVVDIVILDESGKIRETIMEQSPQDQEQYTYKFVLNVANYKKGKYHLLVYSDNQLILLKEFIL